MSALRQSTADNGDALTVDNVLALVTQALIDLNRVAYALEKLAKKG